MEAQPATIGPRDALCLAKEGDEQKQHEIGIDPRLKLEIAREIFRGDPAFALPELERGVEGVIDLLHKHDQRTNVLIAQAGARIVPSSCLISQRE